MLSIDRVLTTGVAVRELVHAHHFSSNALIAIFAPLPRWWAIGQPALRDHFYSYCGSWPAAHIQSTDTAFSVPVSNTDNTGDAPPLCDKPEFIAPATPGNEVIKHVLCMLIYGVINGGMYALFFAAHRTVV